MTILTLDRAGPGLTVQDMGREGHLSSGIARGGAADRRSVLEACALLGNPAPLAAIEMAGPAAISTDAPVRLALTGAPMRATLDGAEVGWNRTIRLAPGQSLAIGAALSGLYGLLTPGGGIATEPVLGSRSAHLGAGVGRMLVAGDALPCGEDRDVDAAPVTLAPEDRFAGGTLRMLAGPQTGLFEETDLTRFLSTAFTRSPKGNRQGIRLDHPGAPFATKAQLDILSDAIVPGDIQMTGDGVPYILLADCQTIGGYPRIGTVLPADLARAAQGPPGSTLRFALVTLEDADRLPTEAQALDHLRRAVRRLVRDPRDMADLLAYQLIGGVTAGDDPTEG